MSESGRLPSIDQHTISRVAELIGSRNAIDAELTALIGRPPVTGHLGEWVAAQIFDIQLEDSASAKGIDGRFRSGPLAGRTVNIKTYGKWDGLLDTSDDPKLDYYLVLSGPRATSMTPKGSARPWGITNVYLFDARQLRDDLISRGIKLGTATSVRVALWKAAEVYPAEHPELQLAPEQAAALNQFSAL